MSWTKSSISTFTNTPHPPTTTINKPWCRLEGGQENKIETKGEYRLALALLLLNALTTIIYNALFLFDNMYAQHHGVTCELTRGAHVTLNRDRP